MKGKLIKMVEGYTLSLTGNIDDLYAISNKELAEDHKLYKLSLKNCQAIERGYDLMDLAEEDSNKYYDLSTVSWHCNYNGFFSGFQKALQILGDKKYSEYDMKSIFEYGWNQRHYGVMDETKLEEIKNIYIQSLQQNEWDVEIMMEDVFIKNSDQYVDEVGVGNYSTHSKRPKLDDDGCLILKRI